MTAWVRSSIGKKVLMAGSGLVLLGFVLAHLAGNLLIYAGPRALNAYAHKLRELGLWFWVARAGLLIAVLIHIVTSLQLAMENRRARPVAYHRQRFLKTTLAARTMWLSGLLILAYLVYHLLHFTFGVVAPDFAHGTDPLGHHDVYRMIVLSFQQWPVVLAYGLGVGFVCLHLSHGIGSVCQTLGVTNERTLPIATRVGRLIAWGIFLGYLSIPLAIWCGLIPSTGRGAF